MNNTNPSQLTKNDPSHQFRIDSPTQGRIEQLLAASQTALTPFLLLTNALMLLALTFGVLRVAGATSISIQRLTLSTAIIVIYGLLGGLWIIWQANKRLQVDSQNPSITKRILQLNETLKKSMNEMVEIQKDLDERTRVAKDIEKRLEKVLPPEQMKVVADLMLELHSIRPKPERRRERRSDIVFQIGLFLLGAVTSVIVEMLF